MKLIFILSALGILLLSWSAAACANPTESFNRLLEVVKPIFLF